MNSEPARVFTIAQAQAAGLSYKRLLGELHRGRIVQLRRGIYCTVKTWTIAKRDAATLHALHVEAAQMRIRSPAWACDYSAAQLFGWPVPLNAVTDVTLTVEPHAAPSRGPTAGIRILPAAVPAEHRGEVLGVPVLSPPRTIVDIARRHGLAAGLVVADVARRRGQVYDKALVAAIEACAGWPGLSIARLVALHAARERESPLESRSFALFIEEGLPLPVCNPWLLLPERVRVDFLWRHHRIVGEADGRVKYDSPELAPDYVLWREKLRAEAIERKGYVLTRWTGPELDHSPDLVVDRILQASYKAHKLYGVPLLG